MNDNVIIGDSSHVVFVKDVEIRSAREVVSRKESADVRAEVSAATRYKCFHCSRGGQDDQLEELLNLNHCSFRKIGAR